MKVLKKILKGIAVIAGLIVIYLAFVTLGPGFDINVPLVKGGKTEIPPPAPAFRKDVNFVVKGSRVSAWLYLPADTSKPVPVVVMAHGFGGTKDFILENYAIRIRNAGFAVLAFDYRFMGKSEGEPRQLIWLPYQLEDLESAVKYVRGLEEVDPDRVALWGTSLGGAHVMMAASRDPKIAAVAAQVPLLDPAIHAEDGGETVWQITQLVMHGQRDIVRMRFNMEPHRIPIFGKPGSVSIMNTPESFEAYEKLTRPGFVNRVCARIILRGSNYRPVDVAHKINVPVLLQLAKKDSLLPLQQADETIKKLSRRAEVKHYDSGHFEIYTGQYFEQSANDQVVFFKKNLFGKK